MRRREFITALLASLAAASAVVGVVEAGMKAGPNMAGPGHHRLKVPSGAALDGFTAPSGAYSFRKLLSFYNGPALRARRASDNAETDINFLGFVPGIGAPWDVAVATAHCAATSCFIKTLYDQSGNARDLIMTTAANQPQLIFDCVGTLPCFQVTAATIGFNTASIFTPATGVASLSAVANRTVGTGNCHILRLNGGTGNKLLMPAANNWGAYGSAGGITRAATDAAWHTAVGVFNGASSSLTIDGGTTAGSLTNATAGAAAGMAGAAATTCNTVEAIFWDNYILTPAQITALDANQRAYITP